MVGDGWWGMDGGGWRVGDGWWGMGKAAEGCRSPKRGTLRPCELCRSWWAAAPEDGRTPEHGGPRPQRRTQSFNGSGMEGGWSRSCTELSLVFIAHGCARGRAHSGTRPSPAAATDSVIQRGRMEGG